MLFHFVKNAASDGDIDRKKFQEGLEVNIRTNPDHAVSVSSLRKTFVSVERGSQDVTLKNGLSVVTISKKARVSFGELRGLVS